MRVYLHRIDSDFGDPARAATSGSRVAWIVVVLTLPVVGIAVYLFPGETSIGVK